MSGETNLLLFVAASAMLIITPGPAVLFIMAQSMSHGRLAGVVTAGGVGVGNLVHVVLAALGLSAVLATSPVAFSTIKYVGAAYLVYLGLRRILIRPPADSPAIRNTPSLGSAFKQGFVVGVFNPKTALFFLAFLPQFVGGGAHPVWLQLLALGLIFVAMAIVGDSSYGLLSGSIGHWLKRHTGFVRFERHASGAVYCLLGIAAAMSGLQRAT